MLEMELALIQKILPLAQCSASYQSRRLISSEGELLTKRVQHMPIQIKAQSCRSTQPHFYPHIAPLRIT